MLDLGWTELLLIGIVALIVVGPKDLPGMFRAVGNFVGKARGMAREFSRAMNEAADQSGVSDIKDTLKKASNPVASAMDEVKKTADDLSRKTKAATKPDLSPQQQARADRIREKAAEMAEERRKAEAAPTVSGDTPGPAEEPAKSAPPEDKA